jgi:hypothetical protein
VTSTAINAGLTIAEKDIFAIFAQLEISQSDAPEF